MTDENIPEKMYSELKHPVCPKCEDPLTNSDDPGVWYCENSGCNYTEYNNITHCQSDWCDNLVLSKDFDFYEMEEKFCQINHPEGGTCLGQAYHEQEIFEAEQYEIDKHMKNCKSPECWCFNI